MRKSSIPLLTTCFVQILLVGFAVSSGSLKVAIVNKETNEKDGKCKKLEDVGRCTFRRLSCRYISHLKEQPFSQKYRSDLEDTVQAARKSELDVSAVVYLNENFTDAFVAKMALGDDADEETERAGQINVWLSKSAQEDTIKQYMQSAFEEFRKDLMTSCGEDLAGNRYTFKDPLHYHYIQNN